MATQVSDVIGGPNKFDLMLSLFEGKKVTFVLEPLGELVGDVHHLHVIDRDTREKFSIMGGFTVGDCVTLFKGVYNCRTRGGRIKTYFMTKSERADMERAYAEIEGLE